MAAGYAELGFLCSEAVLMAIADLGTLGFRHLPWDIYPIGEKWKK